MAARSQQLPYRLGVGVMLLNREGRVFVAKRLDMRAEAWQMPQGGIDPGEEPFDCARRELKEEIGTDDAALIAESKDWYSYDLPEELIGKIWGGRYRGQKQKWFLMRFTGADTQIDLNTEHPEFMEWQWVEPHRLPSLIVSFKQALYEAILAEFRPHLAGV